MTLQTAPNATVKFVSKYAKEVHPITGKVLDNTDVDFIIDDGINLIYYQAKTSATAFASVKEARRWVDIVTKDAELNGVANQVIRYVTPDPDAVADDIFNALDDLGVLIEPSPLLR